MTVQQIQILDITELSSAAACACGENCTCGAANTCGPDCAC